MARGTIAQTGDMLPFLLPGEMDRRSEQGKGWEYTPEQIQEALEAHLEIRKILQCVYDHAPLNAVVDGKRQLLLPGGHFFVPEIERRDSYIGPALYADGCIGYWASLKGDVLGNIYVLSDNASSGLEFSVFSLNTVGAIERGAFIVIDAVVSEIEKGQSTTEDQVSFIQNIDELKEKLSAALSICKRYPNHSIMPGSFEDGVYPSLYDFRDQAEILTTYISKYNEAMAKHKEAMTRLATAPLHPGRDL